MSVISFDNHAVPFNYSNCNSLLDLIVCWPLNWNTVENKHLPPCSLLHLFAKLLENNGVHSPS